MSVRLLMATHRKPGTTPGQFRQHYEANHIPLIRSLAGAHFPLQHIRNYIARDDTPDAGYSAEVLVGQPEDFEYDALCELVFEDQDHLQRFFAAMRTEDAVAKIQADEELFLDRERLRMVVVRERVVAKREG